MDDLDIIYEDDIKFDDDKLNEAENKSVYSATYSVVDKYNKMKNDLENTKNELKLSKLHYESLENDYKLLLKKYENEQQNNKNSNDEIKNIKKELLDKNKNILMLKSLLDLIIKKYGMESISKVTRLNEEQINKYLK